MSKTSPRSSSGYGVKLVRGPFVRLDPHPDSCGTEEEFLAHASRLREGGATLAADLFSGAGGLSWGLEAAGLNVVLSVDHDKEAVQTHRHHFGGLAVDWDLSDADQVERVARLMTEADVQVLAGGPPCQPFSKAGRYLIRDRVNKGLRDPHDQRRDLWRSYLEVVRLARPAAVIMENVPDMALDREMFILRSIVEDLESLGYSVEERIVDTWRYGVPQFRQRLILIALRDGLRFDWPRQVENQVTVWNAIGDLPEVRGGWRPEGGAEGWADYEAPQTSFQRAMRVGVPEEAEHRIYDHITRPVREDDEKAFDMMGSKTRYSDLPEELKRYRQDIFDDKYKRLDENHLSRTITAHIAKDGYWYIHPRQSRTLTVREAARLQTFPDHFRFSGPPSAAFRQIGNAVPPRLGEALGGAVLEAIQRHEPARTRTRDVAEVLATWFTARPEAPRAVPWLNATSRWQVVCAETLLERATPGIVSPIWRVIQLLDQPENPDTADEQDALLDIARAVGREKRANTLSELADQLRELPGALDSDDVAALRLPGLSEAVADLAVLAVPVDGKSSEEPVLTTRGVLRVAERFHADPVSQKNRLTDGRLAIARMIGGGANARNAHKGLIELAATLCRPDRPLCLDCPLADLCRRHGVPDDGSDPLF